jgi:hypothetical protein
MMFQTETVLSCSVPPSSRGFESLNTERDRGIGALTAGWPDESPAWREIAYLRRHAAAGRLQYDRFRCRGESLGSGAIESTDLRLRGTSTS